jgi:hypothetical protein
LDLGALGIPGDAVSAGGQRLRIRQLYNHPVQAQYLRHLKWAKDFLHAQGTRFGRAPTRACSVWPPTCCNVHPAAGTGLFVERSSCHWQLKNGCDLAAYECREPSREIYFEHKTCINAGGGFSMQGETAPRRSDRYPQPGTHRRSS